MNEQEKNLNRHLLPYGTHVGDVPIRLVDRAKEIETAHLSIQNFTNAKLELILKQIQNLQQQAKQILEEAHISAELHKIPCNFEKKVGMILHLYERPNLEKYFSLLSPEEWIKPPHKFLGSFQLKADYTFEKLK